MQIYSGSSHQVLANNLAKQSGFSLGKVDLSRFESDEVRVLVTEEQVDKEVIILQSLSSPTDHHIIEFLMLVDALRRRGAREITAIIPYMGYSKQDKIFREGESLSVKVVAQMLQIMPLSRLLTFDLHNQAILGFFDIPVDSLSASPLFLQYFQKQHLDNYLVVAPDAGAAKKSSVFAASTGLDVVYLDKKRDLNTGEVKINGISGDVEGKNIIIADDMVATGSTLEECSKYLHALGAQSVTIAVTHFLNVQGVAQKLISSGISQIITTNTINFSLPSSKFITLDISPLLRDALV